jgi:hypothetical protein
MESLPIIGILVILFEVLIVMGVGANIFLTLMNRERLNRLLGLEEKLDLIEKYLADLSEEVAMDMNMGPGGHIIEAGSLDELMDKMQQGPMELDQEESDKLRAFFENMLNQDTGFQIDPNDDDDDEPEKPWEHKKKK